MFLDFELGWDCNLQPSKSVTHRQSREIGWFFQDGDHLRMCISWMLSSQICTVHELIGKSQLQVVSVYSKRFPNKRNSSDQKWGFNFRVFPLSHETWSMVEPRMQAGLSSPHFDELRMEPLGSPICWGSVMKDWNHWNPLRDSRNCFCVSCVWGKLSQSELKLSGHCDISWNLAVLTWKNSGEPLSHDWSTKQGGNMNDFLVSCLFKSTD